MSENRRPPPSRGSPSPFFDNATITTSTSTRKAKAKTGMADHEQTQMRVLSERNMFPNVDAPPPSSHSRAAGVAAKYQDESMHDDLDGQDVAEETGEYNNNNNACFDFSAISDSTPPPPPTPFRDYAVDASTATSGDDAFFSPTGLRRDSSAAAGEKVRTPTRKRVDFAALASAKKGKSAKKKKGKKAVNEDYEADEGSENKPAQEDRIRENAKTKEDTPMLDLDVDMSMVVVAAERMQLISPPPEETLNTMRRRSSAQFTPSLVDKDKEKTPATVKRKRGIPRARGQQQPPRRLHQEGSSSARGEDVQMEDANDNSAMFSFDGNHRLEEEEAVEATPNPKPRKLGRRVGLDESPTRVSASSSSQLEMEDVDDDNVPLTPSKSKLQLTKRMLLVQSPHGRNPDADYIPALVLSAGGDIPPAAPETVARRAVLGARGSRRSATPIPPYEPPTDVFTPPREVFLSPPTGATSSRRSVTPVGGADGKGKAKAKSGRKSELRIVTVKKEIPDDIDLRAPMPPPSPTDDPLLLSGPPEQMSSPLGRQRMTSVEVEVQTEPEEEEEVVQVDVLPPSSPDPPFDSEDMRAVDVFEFGREVQGSSSMTEGEDSMVDDPLDADVSPVRLFEGVAETGGWSDSDDDDIGEQIEEGEGEYTGHFRTVRVPTKEDPPSSATKARQEEWGRPISPYPYPRKIEENQEEEEEEREVREMSLTLEDEAEPEESDSDMDNDPALVKITSADPRAAARAAAILKQHDYDCFTKIAMKRRHSNLDSLIKHSRRRDLVSSGITKSRKSAVIGERVFIPGSPSTTLPALLHEAEQEVSRVLHSPRPASPSTTTWNPFLTPEPKPRPSSSMTIYRNNIGRDFVGEAEWTKEEWKLLDACFTDERLDVGSTIEGADQDTLAPVDMVQIENVVDRFVVFIGGQEIIDKRGDAWSRPNLIERTRALQRKQRSGNVAHPTTPRSSIGVSPPFFPRSVTTPDYALGGARRVPFMEVPDFTPLGRRVPPLQLRKTRPILPSPVTQDAPFSNLPPETQSAQKKKVPASLLAPRYSHLLEEAIAIGQEGEFRHPDSGISHEDHEEGDDVANTMNMSILNTPSIARVVVPEAPPTLGKRVKGFLFSYLPTLSSRAPSSSTSQQQNKLQQPAGLALPLPPPEVLKRKISRGPVKTPARPAVPRARPLKEMVRLQHHASSSDIPRRMGDGQKEPKRLVELNHLSPPPEEVVVKKLIVQRQRRSSGSSVKDLVKGFEEIGREEKEKAEKSRMRLGRSKLEGETAEKWRKNALDTRPKWKP